MTVDHVDHEGRPPAPDARTPRTVIARLVAAQLADHATTPPPIERLLDGDLRDVDFHALGLDSLAWMALATKAEEELGVELPDEVLLDPRRRTVTGWAAAAVRTRGADGQPGEVARPRRQQGRS